MFPRSPRNQKEFHPRVKHKLTRTRLEIIKSSETLRVVERNEERDFHTRLELIIS